jgi:hypothetical protein
MRAILSKSGSKCAAKVVALSQPKDRAFYLNSTQVFDPRMASGIRRVSLLARHLGVRHSSCVASSAPSSSSSSSSLVDDPDAVVVARESLVRSVFDQFDTNGNGLLEKDEILALLDGMSEVGPVRLNVASLGEVPDLEAMMAQVDTDGSGEVGFDEFFVWYEEQVAKQERGDDNSLLFRLSRSLG